MCSRACGCRDKPETDYFGCSYISSSGRNSAIKSSKILSIPDEQPNVIVQFYLPRMFSNNTGNFKCMQTRLSKKYKQISGIHNPHKHCTNNKPQRYYLQHYKATLYLSSAAPSCYFLLYILYNFKDPTSCCRQP